MLGFFSHNAAQSVLSPGQIQDHTDWLLSVVDIYLEEGAMCFLFVCYWCPCLRINYNIITTVFVSLKTKVPDECGHF